MIIDKQLFRFLALVQPSSQHQAVGLATREALRNAQQMLHLVIELVQFDAKVTRAKYLALIHEGFEPKQALFLCKNEESS